jgi:uncharacterized membrane protein
METKIKMDYVQVMVDTLELQNSIFHLIDIVTGILLVKYTLPHIQNVERHRTEVFYYVHQLPSVQRCLLG